MRGEVVGLNTLKLIKKNTTGIAFALSASDLLDVLHRFYPVTAPASPPTSALRSSVSKTEQMSAGRETQPEKSPPANPSPVATGTITFAGTLGAEIYVDGKFVGDIPSTIHLSEGAHRIRVTDGKNADWLKLLQVRVGSSVTIRAEFPTAQ